MRLRAHAASRASIKAGCAGPRATRWPSGGRHGNRLHGGSLPRRRRETGRP
ncbi:hypothetical protein I35_7329 [Burkholderia cenocepacia H111]|nr:hypothetical protein I35_7329 [Burkholderia cenocepacia H111]